jgi:hypothetical protein
MFMRIILLCLLLLIAGKFAFAATYSEVDYRVLPVFNIFDPIKGENERITEYSFEEISGFMENPRFRMWNDIPKVCQSVQIMFGRAAPSCTTSYLEHRIISPRTMRAYYDISYFPPPRPQPRGQVLIVDPVFPPWSPTYAPHW